ATLTTKVVQGNPWAGVGQCTAAAWRAAAPAPPPRATAATTRPWRKPAVRVGRARVFGRVTLVRLLLAGRPGRPGARCGKQGPSAAVVPRFGYGGPHRRAAGGTPAVVSQGSAEPGRGGRRRPPPLYQPFSNRRATSAMRTSSHR